MTTARRHYPTAFKIKAVELSNLKGSVNQVAKELDVSEKISDDGNKSLV